MASETTSRLTMVAEALGFDASAKSVETLAAAQARLAENQKALDVAKTGGSVEDVARLVGEQEKLSFVVGELQPKQQTLNASQRDYISLLNTIHPSVGQFVDGLVRAVKVSGELASKNIDVKGAVGAATGAIKENIGAIKLLGAGGAAILAIEHVLYVWSEIRGEIDRANQSLDRHVAALNELQKGKAEQQVSLENLSDQRPEGGFSKEESPLAQAAAARIKSRFRQLEEKNIEAAIVALFGTGVDDEQLTQAAILQQSQAKGLNLDPKRRASIRRANFEAVLGRNRPAVEEFVTRESGQQDGGAAGTPGEGVREAVGQSRAQGGPTFDLEQFIRNLPGGVAQGFDVSKLARVVQEVRGGVEVGDAGFFRAFVDAGGAFSDQFHDGQGNAQSDLENRAARLRQLGIKDATPDLLRAAEFILKQLEKMERLLDRPTTVINNNQNSKTVIDGKGRAVNGDSRARDVETR